MLLLLQFPGTALIFTRLLVFFEDSLHWIAIFDSVSQLWLDVDLFGDVGAPRLVITTPRGAYVRRGHRRGLLTVDVLVILILVVVMVSDRAPG